MNRIDSSDAVSNLFDGGDPAVPRLPTQLTPKWLNGVQEELIGLIVAGGLAPNDANNAQVLAAIQALIATPTAPAYFGASGGGGNFQAGWANVSGERKFAYGKMPTGEGFIEGYAVRASGGNLVVAQLGAGASLPNHVVRGYVWTSSGPIEFSISTAGTIALGAAAGTGALTVYFSRFTYVPTLTLAP